MRLNDNFWGRKAEKIASVDCSLMYSKTALSSCLVLENHDISYHHYKKNETVVGQLINHYSL